MDGVSHLDISIVGEGASPDTAPAEVLIAIADAYLAALRKVAEQNSIELGSMVGVELKTTSATLRVQRVDAAAAAEADRLLRREMATPGAAEMPHLQGLAVVQKRLPDGWFFATAVGNDERRPMPTVAAKRETFVELTTRRVQIVGLAFEPDMKITVYDRRQDRRYALRCDRAILGEALERIAAAVEAARELHADVKARLVRDQAAPHKILGGEVLRLSLVDDDWTVDGLLSWFRATFRPDPA